MESSAPPPPKDHQGVPPTYHEAMGGVGPSYTAPGPTGPPIIIPGPTIVHQIIPLGSRSTHMICPHCHAQVLTETQAKPGMIAYIAGTVIALLGCWCGCCLIPCFMEDCMDVQHSCPNCKAFLGHYRR